MKENKKEIHWEQIEGLWLPEMSEYEILKSRKFYSIPNTRYPSAADCYSYAFLRPDWEALLYFNTKFIKHYQPTDFKNLHKGDIIAFRNHNFITKHIAVVARVKYSLGGTIVESKFSNLGVFQYMLKHNPFFYGIECALFKNIRNIKKEELENG
jgi:hypothetical protein